MMSLRSGLGFCTGLPALVVMAACSSNPPPLPVNVSADVQPLAAGDAIRIDNWREMAMSGEYQIDETGHVVLPLLGRVEAAGADPVELKNSLLEGYAREFRDPDIEITFLRRVAVLGAVGAPGLYLVDPTMRLADVVAKAEGATPDGDILETKVIRDGEDISGSVALDVPLLNQLEPGDQVFIPERPWFERNGVFVLGSMVTAAAIIIAASIR